MSTLPTGTLSLAPRINPLTLRFPREWERAFFDDYHAKSLTTVRLVLLILGVVTGFEVLDGQIGRGGPIDPGAFGGQAIVVAILAGSFWTPFKPLLQPAVALLALIIGLVNIEKVAASAGTPGALNEVAISLVLTMIFAFNFSRIGFVYAAAVSLVTTVAFVIAGTRVTGPELNSFHLILVGLILTMFSGYVTERHMRREFIAQRLLSATLDELRSERARSERLLLNILPAPIAERLKAGEETIADAHDDVTVLFADVVDFTRTSSRVSPVEMVALLNTVFSSFDAIAARHRLEKIKTVGDAYMVVGGLPNPRPDHAEAVAEMALEMQRALAGVTAPGGEPLRVRIGINSGPVVAGVIGTAKFAYDLWGDAVNTASRMESHGVPDGIQVTQSTYEKLRDRYDLVERGPIEVKGKGVMQTYLLLDRRPEPRSNLTAAVQSTPA